MSRPRPRRSFLAAWFGGSMPAFFASVLSMLMMLYVLKSVVSWGILDASFTAGGFSECAEVVGACWVAATHRLDMIFFGLYPSALLWRAQTGLAILVVAIVLTCMPSLWRVNRLLPVWLVSGIAFLVVMRGGIFGLAPVPTSQWGGFTLNLFIFFCVIVAGMPIAVVLALMRQSELRGIRFVAGAFIDLTRSLPLVGILFFAVLIFPLVLPRGLETDTLIRVIVAFAFFFGCYEAEVLRGGFQSIARGQTEASDSLGLTYWQRTRLIMMPQVLEKSFPTTLNQFVITFKETSLVFIVGLFDVLRASEVLIGMPGWGSYYLEVYTVTALLFFAVTFTLSHYGRFLENRIAQGRNR